MDARYLESPGNSNVCLTHWPLGDMNGPILTHVPDAIWRHWATMSKVLVQTHTKGDIKTTRYMLFVREIHL